MGEDTLKRQREQTNDDASDAGNAVKRRRQKDRDALKLSKLYNDLAAESEETRLDAAQQFVLKFAPENGASAEDVKRAIVRLIRGLCSARKAARLGFFVTVTELFRQIFGPQAVKIEALSLRVDDLFDLIEENTKVEKNASGKEKRDQLIGKLSAFKSLLQSGLLLGTHLETWSKVLDRLYGLARDTPWLREECGQIVVEAITSLESKQSLKDFATEIITKLVSSGLAHTPEGVAIWLALREQFDDVLPAKVWEDRDPLSKKERKRLAQVLKEDFRLAQDSDSNEKVKTGVSNPNPSFVWNVVLSETLRRDEAQGARSARAEFPQFWIDVVDNNLFAMSASHERKSWGIKLFAGLSKVVPDSIIPALFTPNLTRCLSNQSKSENTYLYEAAMAALKVLKTRSEKTPASAAPLFIALTSNHAVSVLDRDYATNAILKTLEQVMLHAEDDSLRKIVRHLGSLILRPETKDESIAYSRRQRIVDLLLHIVKHYKRYDENTFLDTSEHDNWLRKVLAILVEHSYFKPTQTAKTSKFPLPPVSEATRKQCQERLSSCLTRLLDVPADPRAGYALLVARLVESEAASSTREIVFEADESVSKVVGKAMKTIEKLATKKSSSKKGSAAQGFILLYSLALLQIYNGDTDAVLLLDDLDAASKPMLKKHKDEGTHGQESLVEILLTFLGNPRSLFNRIAQEVFKIFIEDMTSDGLQAMTDILDTPENLEGQRELFKQDDEDEGEEEDSDAEDSDVEDVEDMSDVEMVNGKLAGAVGGTADDSDSVPGSDSEEGDEDSANDENASESGDDNDDEELAAFDNLLAQTLQTSKFAANAEDDTSDESDMDDEQMMELDPHLSKIFKERNKMSSKKQNAEAKQTVIQFKSRILDLLAIFVEKQYSSPLSFEVLLPILRRLRPDASPQIAQKANKLLQQFLNRRKQHKAPFPATDNLDHVVEILASIHEEAALGGGYTMHANACASASLHIAKALVSTDKENYARILEVYSKTQNAWFTDSKSGIQPVLFSQFLNWSVTVKKGK